MAPALFGNLRRLLMRQRLFGGLVADLLMLCRTNSGLVL
jgi:hypothetical protein